MNARCSSPPPGPIRTLVFGDRPGSRYLAGRTLRALGERGIAAEDACAHSSSRLAEMLAATRGPVWMVLAGAWPARDGPWVAPPQSSTGLPLCALGSVLPHPGENTVEDEAAQAWARLLTATGGDLARAADLGSRLPFIASAYLETPLVRSLADRLAVGESVTRALHVEVLGSRRRAVRIPTLDVHFDPALRVVQVVTSLQHGGAERIALELHRTLGGYGVRSLLIALGSPTRTAYPTPAGAVDVSAQARDRQQRVALVASTAVRFAADVVHVHLLNGEDVARLARCGLPLLLTIHNMRPGWPEGLAMLRPGDAALLVACSQAVESEVRRAGLPFPTRTVWNGIDFAPLDRTPALEMAGREVRQRLGIGVDDFMVLALANPRPQKRLELLPPILAAAQGEFARRGITRAASLVVAGEAARGNQAAAAAEAALRAAAAQCGLDEDRVHLVGAINDVAPLLNAADVLVCASAYEGLSLAHLEALAAGLPVVATAVGGTAEIAQDNPAMRLLTPDSPPGAFAAVLAELAESRPPSGRRFAEAHFTRFRMAEGYRRLYPRAIQTRGARRPSAGLWLVANNFSTGGAQSSARRLLSGLAAQGTPVRAAVLEEQEEYPTPGRRALTAAGIPVIALPPAEAIDPAEAVARLLECIDDDPPQVVLLWNVIAQHKVLLADGLLDMPLFDVSPGEMYFTSLEKYFQRPRPGLPYRTPRQYGARLSGVIVKYQGEAAQAAEWLEAPVHVVPNGVPVDPCPGARAPRDRLVIGTTARISRQKRLEELLLALRAADGRLPPYVLRIAGGVERGAAEYAQQLRQLADGLPVEWVGELDDPRPFYRDLDLFAMISEPAGCPNASLEAMAAGLPVIATDVGGAAEQVEDGVTGWLVPRGDAAALASALVGAARDPESLVRCGTAGRARVEACFDEKRMVADYRRILFGETSKATNLHLNFADRS